MPDRKPEAGRMVEGGLGEAAALEYDRVQRRGQIREVVFGMQDGLVSNLSLVVGVHGAAATRSTILVAGLAGALAGTISMSLGAYIAARSQRDIFEFELNKEREQLARRPFVERMELADILIGEGLSQAAATRAASAIGESEYALLKTMAEKELGIALEPPSSPMRDALVMGGAFVTGSLVPVVPYLVLSVHTGLVVSVLATLLALFAMGTVKGRLSGENWWRSGVQICVLAGLAALLSYGVGQVLPGALGIKVPAG
jgi:vacuolar iron transporter family protein